MAENKDEKKPKKENILARFANQFGANLTGRGAQATDENKYLSESEKQIFRDADAKMKERKKKKKGEAAGALLEDY